LALLGIKFTLFSYYNPAFRLWDDTKPLLYAESNELKSRVTGVLPRFKVSLLSALYTYIPGLPVSFVTKQLTQIVAKETKVSVSDSKINRGLIDKQIRRQGLDFDFHDEYSRMQRKNHGKGYDLLTEAAILSESATVAPAA